MTESRLVVCWRNHVVTRIAVVTPHFVVGVVWIMTIRDNLQYQQLSGFPFDNFISSLPKRASIL
jgi:hypothetical protein